MRKRYDKYDVVYYVPKRKKPITGSTIATSIFLTALHEKYPKLTIKQFYCLLNDRSMCIYDKESINILAVHIKLGYGDCVPNWK